MIYQSFPTQTLRKMLDNSRAFACVVGPSGQCRIFDSAEPAGEDDESITICNFGVGDKPSVTLYDAYPASQLKGEPMVQAATEVENRELYIANVSAIIAALQANGGKTVYARRKLIFSPKSPIDVAVSYFADHKQELCFIYYTPATGLWIGATPELIVEKKGTTYRTMALAGTKSLADSSAWDEKNILEHEFVTNHIIAILRNQGLEIDHIEQSELNTGRVRHLLHNITARGEADLAHLTSQLSPTPAILGTPQQQALAHISQYEQLPRLCYGGEIIIKTKNIQASYLNLRCALASYHSKSGNWIYNLFVGGGITAQSVAEDEWDETELKSRSLESSIVTIN